MSFYHKHQCSESCCACKEDKNRYWSSVWTGLFVGFIISLFIVFALAGSTHRQEVRILRGEIARQDDFIIRLKDKLELYQHVCSIPQLEKK